MAGNPYAARQASIKFFNGIIYASGVAFNVFALASLINFALTVNAPPDPRMRARVEMEDANQCTKHMSGRKFSRGGEDFLIHLKGGADLTLHYDLHSTYGYTRDGDALEMVQVRYMEEAGGSGLLFFIVNSSQEIKGCVSPYTYPMNRNYRLDCLAAAGEYQPNGDCTLPVKQPSDCRMMNGILTDKYCVVPPGNRILRAGLTSKGKACTKPDCES